MMNVREFLKAGAIAAVCAVFPAEAAEQKVLRVLLIDGQNNHQWQATTPVLKKALEAAGGRFAVTVSTAPGDKSGPADWEKWRPDFSACDVVVSNYNGQAWPVSVRIGFEAFVKGGGGFVCIHAADNSFPDWAEYNQMIGLGGWGGRTEKHGPYVYVKDGKLERDMTPGSGGSHGAQLEFQVELFGEGKDHPVTKGMPASWKHAKDELYSTLRGPAENMKVLAVSPCPDTNRSEPMIMVLDYGKGRVMHTPMGHADYSMKDAGFWSVLQRGTEWAATGAVTIPLPAKFPGKDEVVVAE
jgi:type 1 glutamine amidotransferase